MRLWVIVVIAGSLGLSLFVCICVGVAIGHFIDVHAGTSPWGLILFSFIGAISGFWTLYKKALSYQQDEARHGRHLRK
ncbi:AtpZ/AtpI family protein [Megasphaera sp.]|uniref:AtpZ/AtpI family protein n=1 Tax=Megasphaera sp. TaxID=2023260 RepID=UPI003FD729B3